MPPLAHQRMQVQENAAPSKLFALLGWLLIASAALAFRLRIPLLVFNSFSFYDVALALAGSMLLVKTVLGTGTRVRLGDRRTFGILLLPIPASILSLVWSQDPLSTVKSLFYYVEAILAFLLAVNLFDRLPSRSIMERMTWFVLLVLAGSVFSYMGIPGFDPMPDGLIASPVDAVNYLASYHSRLSHPFIGLSNCLATVLAFFPMIFLTYGIAYKDRKLLLCFWILLAAVVLTFSRGTILSLLICLFCYLVNARGTVGLVTKFIAVALVGMIAASVAYHTTFSGSEYSVEQILEARTQAFTISERIKKLDRASEMIGKAPLLGYGGGVTPEGDWTLTGGVHNAYVQQVVYFGLPLGLLLSIALLSLPLPFLAARHSNDPRGMVSFGVGLGMVGQLLIFTTQASYEGSLLRVLFYFSLGMGIALLRSVRFEAMCGSARTQSQEAVDTWIRI